MIGIYILGILGALFLIYRKKQYRKYFFILLIGSFFAFFLKIKMIWGTETELLSEIWRQGKNGKDTVVNLKAEITNAEEGYEEKIQMKVGSLAYTEEELELLENELWDRLEKDLLGENLSLENVTEPLFFPEKVDGYPFFLTWSSNQPTIVSSEGSLGENIPEDGELVEVCLHITDSLGLFEKERIFYIKVFPSQAPDAFWKRLRKYLTETEKLSRHQEKYQLPDTFEGKSLRFYIDAEDKSKTIFLLSVFATVLIIMVHGKEQEKEDKNRLSEIEREYPQMVVHIAMLTDTGLPISGAFKRIANDYGRKRQKKAKPLYEEMLVACREMDSGISEITAYQNMGKRCRVTCMIRFTALLVQYKKSGAAGLKQALQEEAEVALQERKEYARRKGEEAGTKLLVPMMLMLVLVMVVIMIPAFTSFGI